MIRQCLIVLQWRSLETFQGGGSFPGEGVGARTSISKIFLPIKKALQIKHHLRKFRIIYVMMELGGGGLSPKDLFRNRSGGGEPCIFFKNRMSFVDFFLFSPMSH